MKKAPTIYSRLLGGNRTDGGGEDIIVYTTDKAHEGPEYHFSKKYQRGVAFAGVKDLPSGLPDLAAAMDSPGLEVTFDEGIRFVSDGIMPTPRSLLEDLIGSLVEMSSALPSPDLMPGPLLAGLLDPPKEDIPQRFEPLGPDGPVVFVHGNPPPDILEKMVAMFKDPKFLADLERRHEHGDHDMVTTPLDKPMN